MAFISHSSNLENGTRMCASLPALNKIQGPCSRSLAVLAFSPAAKSHTKDLYEESDANFNLYYIGLD